LNDALGEVEIAISSGKGRFEAYCLKADLLIELRQFEEAMQVLDYLRTKFGFVKEDIQLGLRCKLYIRTGEWRQAEITWRSIRNKNAEVATAMLRQIYELKTTDHTISLVERKKAQDELALLDPDLRDLSDFYSADEPEE